MLCVHCDSRHTQSSPWEDSCTDSKVCVEVWTTYVHVSNTARRVNLEFVFLFDRCCYDPMRGKKKYVRKHSLRNATCSFTFDLSRAVPVFERWCSNIRLILSQVGKIWKSDTSEWRDWNSHTSRSNITYRQISRLDLQCWVRSFSSQRRPRLIFLFYTSQHSNNSLQALVSRFPAIRDISWHTMCLKYCGNWRRDISPRPKMRTRLHIATPREAFHLTSVLLLYLCSSANREFRIS